MDVFEGMYRALIISILLLVGCKGNEAQRVQGQQLYLTSGCQKCHTIDGRTTVGPSMKGWAKGQNNAYFKTSLLAPMDHIAKGFAPTMPSFKDKLSEKDIEALWIYVQSLE